MKTLTITKAGQITHGPSSFPSDSELQEHLSKHIGMGSYGDPDSYEVLIEDVTDKVAQEKTNSEALAYLVATDFKVLRHIRQQALGIATSLTAEEYIELEHLRQMAADSITNR